jgi:thiamine biosynthesis lipoprotein
MKRHSYILPIIVICTILGLTVARNLRGTGRFYSDTAILMGTVVEVSVWGRGRVPAAAAVDSALNAIASVEKVYGNGRVGPPAIRDFVSSPEFTHLMDISRAAYTKTNGLFDPTIGAISSLWEFRDGAEPPPTDSIAAAVERVGLDRYLGAGCRSDAVLDLGGVAKGYAVDLAAGILVDLGFKSAIVNAGGDMRLIGKRADGEPWRIAIRHPRQQGEFIGYLDLENAAVATSGDYEKFFLADGKRYHHILDPRTGFPGLTCESATVVTSTACSADALATGFFLMGPRRAVNVIERHDDLEGVFVFADGESLLVSTGLAGRFGRFESE